MSVYQKKIQSKVKKNFLTAIAVIIIIAQLSLITAHKILITVHLKPGPMFTFLWELMDR